MKKLPIVWQRLVTPDGRTCERCGTTQKEMERAVEKLSLALAPLGIRPVLETRAIDEKTFKANPAESNRIWMGGRPMEEWLEGKAGASPCCSVCGESECRTVEVEETVFEAIPENLILKAGLLAASSLIEPATRETPPSQTANSGRAGRDK
ncbi:MAG TPA: DUF2703 domain-containing protein [Verrucomicrobiae bacterium]|nr:DUF2703 domain-containing protein [Verrucomicrobiae bacterium]